MHRPKSEVPIPLPITHYNTRGTRWRRRESALRTGHYRKKIRTKFRPFFLGEGGGFVFEFLAKNGRLYDRAINRLHTCSLAWISRAQWALEAQYILEAQQQQERNQMRTFTARRKKSLCARREREGERWGGMRRLHNGAAAAASRRRVHCDRRLEESVFRCFLLSFRHRGADLETLEWICVQRRPRLLIIEAGFVNL